MEEAQGDELMEETNLKPSRKTPVWLKIIIAFATSVVGLTQLTHLKGGGQPFPFEVRMTFHAAIGESSVQETPDILPSLERCWDLQRIELEQRNKRNQSVSD